MYICLCTYMCIYILVGGGEDGQRPGGDRECGIYTYTYISRVHPYKLTKALRPFLFPSRSQD